MKRLPQYLTNKDIAQTLQINSRTVMQWIARTGLKPTIPACAANRWSPADAQKLLDLVRRHWRNHSSLRYRTDGTKGKARKL